MAKYKVPFYEVTLVRDGTVSIDAPGRRCEASEQSMAIARQALEGAVVEEIIVIALDVRLRAIACHRVARGNLFSVGCEPRTVFQFAMLCNAHAIVLAHNHPSGDPTPSAQDVQFTHRIAEIGGAIGTTRV